MATSKRVGGAEGIGYDAEEEKRMEVDLRHGQLGKRPRREMDKNKAEIDSQRLNGSGGWLKMAEGKQKVKKVMPSFLEAVTAKISRNQESNRIN